MSSNTLLAQYIPEFDYNKNEVGAVYQFSFVHITDVHIGEGQGDYGTSGFKNDTMPNGDVGYSAERLRKAVNWINNNYIDKNLKFIIVSGDLTDSGEKSEFDKFKEIMNASQIPFVPTIGNHDAWPYVRFKQESHKADGDSIINSIFEDTYNNCATFFDNWDNGTRLNAWLNPETNDNSYLFNFYFEYNNFNFYMIDFNPRYHVNKNEPGIGPEAQLYDYDGGTFQWLKSHLANNQHLASHNTFIISHQPPSTDIVIMPFYTLDATEYDKMMKILYPYQSNLAVWLAGHIHRDKHYMASTLNGYNVMEVFETRANKEYEDSYFRIYNVYGVPNVVNGIKNNQNINLSIYPNPSIGRFEIDATHLSSDYLIKVADASGKTVMNSSLKAVPLTNGVYQFDFSTLNKGIYFMTLYNDDNIETIRLVVQ
ncbi:MAG: metallophosphoesterase [Chitinophagales bacterium]|nr:metallophosphoesterase [Chitinophagales bacterium]